MANNIFKFEELRVYQETLLFIDIIYILSQKFPKEELFGLVNQLRRAAVSIALNIAEGSSRTKKDFIHFLSLSRGSCYECVAILQIARNRKYISEPEYQNFYEKSAILAKMISALRKSLL